MTNYEYIITEDISLDVLKDNIEHSGMSDKSIEHLDFQDTNLHVHMDNELSSEDEDILDTIIANLPTCSWQRKLRNEVNILTHQIIIDGTPFPVSGANGGYAIIPMSEEDQRNYIGLIISKDFMTYTGADRVTIKCLDMVTGDDVYYKPESSADIVLFWGAGLQHVKGSLEDGWVIKNEIMGLNLIELKEWVDPRL